MVFPAPCRHCTRLLHGEVRFCPYCGGEEAAVHADAGAMTATTEAGRWKPERAEAMPQFAVDSSFVPRRELQQRVGFPSVPGASKPPREGADNETALLGPAAFEWPEGLPAVITVEPRMSKPRLGALLTKPVAIGTALTLSVIALVLSLGPLQAGRQADPDKLQEPTAKLEQAQGALGRGDLDNAQRELGALAAAYPGHAGVQSLQDELDQREREQAVRREQLRDAAQKAAQALGLGALPLSPSPASAPVTPVEAPAATPAPQAVAVQEPRTMPCSEAMAALALCAQEDPRQASAR
ncbi:hypothetical protein A8M77_33990 [Variovorax sp. JS1663]|nr:hypothetical protein A8M77_33990 [Variovorax sp. JS1663]